jgi:membrane-associated phospholipid phosphatase
MIEPRRPSWWITPALLLCVFVVLLWQVSSHGVVTTVDLHVRNGIQDAATSAGLQWLEPVGRACADLGDEEPAILFLVVVGLFAAVRARTWRPLLVMLGAGLVLASVIPLKIWVDRPGPGQAVLGNANLGFFPSGHTADSMCCYITAAFLLSAFVWTGPRAQRELAASALAIVVLTIFGLLWSNFHWLSDVVGSLCWCGAWLLLLFRYADRPVRPERSPAEAGTSAGG